MTLIGSPKDSNTHKQLSQALFGIEEFDNDDARTRHSVAFFSNWNAWQENGLDHTLANLSILSHLGIQFTEILAMQLYIHSFLKKFGDGQKVCRFF